MQRAGLVALVVLVIPGCGGDERRAPERPEDEVVIPHLGTIDPSCGGSNDDVMRYRAFDTATTSVVVRVPGRRRVARVVHPLRRLRIAVPQGATMQWTFVQRIEPATLRATLRIRFGSGFGSPGECIVEEADLAVRLRRN